MANGGSKEYGGLAFRLPQDPVPKGGAYDIYSEPRQKAYEAKAIEGEEGLLPGVDEHKQYFDQLSELNKFVTDSAEKGYDVTKIDLADKESMFLNDIYRRKMGHLRKMASNLKFQKTMEEARLKQTMMGKLEPSLAQREIDPLTGLPRAHGVERYETAVTTDLPGYIKAHNTAVAKKVYSGSEFTRLESKAEELRAQVDADVDAEIAKLQSGQTSRYMNIDEAEMHRDKLKRAVQGPIKEIFKPHKPDKEDKKGQAMRDLAMQRKRIIAHAQEGVDWALQLLKGGKYDGKEISDIGFERTKEGSNILLYFKREGTNQVDMKRPVKIKSGDFHSIDTIISSRPGEKKVSSEVMEEIGPYTGGIEGKAPDPQYKEGEDPLRNAENEYIASLQKLDTEALSRLVGLDYKGKTIESAEPESEGATTFKKNAILIKYDDGSKEIIDLRSESYSNEEEMYNKVLDLVTSTGVISEEFEAEGGTQKESKSIVSEGKVR